MTTENWEREQVLKRHARRLMGALLLIIIPWLSPYTLWQGIIFVAEVVGFVLIAFVVTCAFGWVFSDLEFANKDDN